VKNPLRKLLKNKLIVSSAAVLKSTRKAFHAANATALAFSAQRVSKR